MSVRRVQLRRGTHAENDAFTGAVGEVTVDTTNNSIRVHDGATAGGAETLKADMSNLPSNVLSENGTVSFADSAGNTTVRITNVANPTDNQDVATKAYVDSGGAGLEVGELSNVTIGGGGETALADAQILIYDNADSVFRNKALSSDLTISHEGAVTISALAVDNGKIANATIANAKLVNDSVTVGSTEIDLGATSTTLSGMTGIDFTNASATIGATMTDDGGGNPTVLTLGGAGSQVAITGDLVVGGTTTTVNTATLDVEDTVIRLNKGVAGGANTNDIGLFLERGTTGDDAIFFWDEGEDIFKLGTTTDAHTDTDFGGNLTFGTLKVGSLNSTGASTVSGLLNCDGGLEIDNGGNVFTVSNTGAITATNATSSFASGSSIGNITISDGNLATTGGTFNFNDDHITTSGNISTTGAGTLSIAGTTTLTGLVSLDGGATVDTDQVLNIKKATNEADKLLILNSDVGVADGQNAVIGVDIGNGAYSTITWQQDETTWAFTHSGSFATDFDVGQDLVVTRNTEIGADLTVKDTLFIESQPTDDLGLVFNSDRGANNINGADYDVKIITVEAGTSNATEGTVNWDDDQGSFSIDSGKLHSNTDFSVGTAIGNKLFTVAQASGNTAISGTLNVTSDFNINTDKFQVTGASGNTTVAGTFDVTGQSTLDDTLNIKASPTNSVAILLNSDNADADITVFKVNDTTANVQLDWDDSEDSFVVSGGKLHSNTDFSVGTAIGNQLFTVAQASGNTAISGTLGVTGVTTLSDNLDVSDNNINNVGVISLDTIQSADDVTTYQMLLDDNQATALNINEAGTSYQKFVTTNGGEKVVFGKLIEAPVNSVIADFTISNGSIVSATGTIDFDNENLISTGTADFGATTVDSLSVSEGNITNVGDISLDTISSDGTTVQVLMDDNVAGSFEIKEGVNSYIKVDTTDGSELVTVSKDLTITGTTTFSGTVDLDQALTINESGNAVDFRVEGDNQTHLLYTDGTNDRVGINNNAPTVQLDVTGDTLITGTTTVSGTTSLNGAVVVNESGADVDFRVEGDNEVNLIFADASADSVGIGNNSPSKTLDITGTLGLSSDATFAGVANFTSASQGAVTFNSDLGAGDAPAVDDDFGLTVNRGSSTDAKLYWDEGNDVWQFETGNLQVQNSVVADSDAGGAITISSGSITSASGAISFNDENLSSTGTADFGATTVDSLSVSDGNITNVGDIALDSISADGTDISINVSDTQANGFKVQQGANETYIHVDTNAETLTLDQTTIFSSTLGITTPSQGAITFNSDNTAEQDAHDFGITVNRPSAGVNAKLYWDEGNNVWQFETGNLQVQNSIVADSDAGGAITISDGSITSASGAISFNDENLTTTGTLGAGATTVTSLSVTNDGLTAIVLNSDLGAVAPTQDVGITVERGNSTDATIHYDETANTWKLNRGEGTGAEVILTNNDTLFTVQTEGSGGGSAFTFEQTDGSTLLFQDAGNGQLVITNANGTISLGLEDSFDVVTDLGVGRNLTVTGNIIGNGARVSFNDPIVQIADGNSSNVNDLGFYGEYVNSGANSRYAGLLYQPDNVSDNGVWKLFDLHSDAIGSLDTNVTVTDAELSTLDIDTLNAKGGNVVITKTATTTNEDTASGNFTSNNGAISVTVTLNGNLADDARRGPITVTSDKVLSTSVVLGNASVQADTHIHSVVAGSFKFDYTNRSGGDLVDDSTIVFNFVIM